MRTAGLANTAMMGVTASRAVQGPSRMPIRAPARPVHSAPSQMEPGCVNHVVWARHQMRTSNTVLAAPPTRPELVDCARSVVPESSQMQNGVRALRALLAGLESEVAAKHALPVSSRTMQ